MGARAVFLDRDDTLLVDSGYMNDPDQVCLCEGVPLALERLQAAGAKIRGAAANGEMTVEEAWDQWNRTKEELISEAVAAVLFVQLGRIEKRLRAES